VDRINNEELAKISGKVEIFEMDSFGRAALIEQLKKGCLSPENLSLKIGASVMFTKNNQNEGFVNGTLGTVVGFAIGTMYPIVETKDGRRITVEPAEWVIEDNNKIL